MADTREVRTFASEVKFLVGPEQGERIRSWARSHLDPDPHGTGAFGDEYTTSSVYFDTDEHDVFHRRGSFGRSKYRIRRYGQDDVVFLERKLREPTVLAKRRTVTPLDGLQHLDRGHVDPAWSGRWFHQRLLARRLRPACQVTYRRTARMAVTNGDIVRLTLDDDVSVVPAARPTFAAGDAAVVLPDRLVLELKFRHHLPALFKHLVEQFALTPQPASKYRLGMVALGRFSAAEMYQEPASGELGASASYV